VRSLNQKVKIASDLLTPSDIQRCLALVILVTRIAGAMCKPIACMSLRNNAVAATDHHFSTSGEAA
jgi:hypothetical protein